MPCSHNKDYYFQEASSSLHPTRAAVQSQNTCSQPAALMDKTQQARESRGQLTHSSTLDPLPPQGMQQKLTKSHDKSKQVDSTAQTTGTASPVALMFTGGFGVFVASPQRVRQARTTFELVRIRSLGPQTPPPLPPSPPLRLWPPLVSHT